MIWMELSRSEDSNRGQRCSERLTIARTLTNRRRTTEPRDRLTFFVQEGQQSENPSAFDGAGQVTLLLSG